MDKIIVRKLNVRNIIGVDSWERSKRQPLNIDLTVHQDINSSGESDLLSHTISYGTVAKAVQAFSEKTSYRSVEALASGIARICVQECGAECVTVRVEKPRALLHAACAGVEITRSRRDIELMESLKASGARRQSLSAEDIAGEDQIFIQDLTLNTIIGVNPWEREERQRVILTLVIHLQFNPLLLIEDHVPKVHNYRTITRTVSQYVEQTDYKTVEALATSVAKLMIEQCHVPKVTIRVEKPSAIVFAAAAGVEITRDRAFFGLKEPSSGSQEVSPTSGGPTSRGTRGLDVHQDSRLSHTVLLAIGSNLGNRAQNIEGALCRLEGSPAIQIVDTSFLYETTPMYVADQPNFLNAAVKVRTSLEPEALLGFLKGIESEMGRDFDGQRFGPRPIDLDILCYDYLEMSNETLTIPHPRIKEREFVLRPLCDIAPDMEIPGLFRTASQLLALLGHSEQAADHHIHKVIPLGSGQIWNWSKRTYIMGILNVTPDSFSDGGEHFSIDAATEYALTMVNDGADIIDIGGMSTRPNADEITEEEELKRVIPVIEAIRKRNQTIPISVDTYRASVAKAAVEAGADLINDVTGASSDPAMLTTMANSKAPVCLMHMRGTPKTMTKLTNYENDDVIQEIRRVLGTTVSKAVAKGVRRWNIIVDPGIGFAKNADQNFDILRGLRDMVKPKSELAGFPTLVGPSRKGFLGHALKADDPKNRVWGTAAACSAAVAGGANVLRVHDVKEMKDVIVIADRCFRK
ncbi:dihydropteroate synthase [Spizellomyces punctatus DAOM BR117]|uniref:Folic acid synthesis protein FOL1 n=1 Tax=Spizellomyces punctatus (strain DAOM BR117) TaxID=645134 RepID=A0A0L0HTS1_SPIPD|nr:dihydropteroate synthase [Spizellomyces punctatus DAOM BR117]KND04741.1 dihydropteroate synthase [Spizellomyces punctatus DAOM BR117]|eukprot:XP_016612780.1 dihydropteroate synthase [Spizellomyces punctatus DAOM BR117]